MSIQIEEATREQVAEFLPAALKKALSSYEDFMNSNNAHDTTENFSKHHTACKVALAHVQLLLRLAEWANVQLEHGVNQINMMEIAFNETNNKKFLDSQNIGEEG